MTFFTFILLTVIFAAFIAFLLFTDYRSKIHQKEMNESRKKLIKCYIEAINQCADLVKVYRLHVRLWKDGLQHPDFSPSQHGMFRTNNISAMMPDEVYLGGICGLTTHNLIYWDTESDDYNIVLTQYKTRLINALRWMLF